MNEGVLIGGGIALFLVVCVLLEAFIITALKLARLPRALLQALIVNSASATLVYVLWPLIRSMNLDESKAFPLLPILVLSTILVEMLGLKLLNTNQAWSRTFRVALVMNVASFAVLFLLLSLL